jgi:hypothetical protein
LLLAGSIAGIAALAGTDTAVAQDPPPRRSFGPDLTPGGPGTFNPTGPSIGNPPGAVAPMPPGGRGSFNPTGPLPGAPPGYVQPMPRGGAGSFNPTAPDPQPSAVAIPGLPKGGVNSPRRPPPTRSGGKAPVGPGLDNCLAGYSSKRGLSRAEHNATCQRIWAKDRRGPPA